MVVVVFAPGLEALVLVGGVVISVVVGAAVASGSSLGPRAFDFGFCFK